MLIILVHQGDIEKFILFFVIHPANAVFDNDR